MREHNAWLVVLGSAFVTAAGWLAVLILEEIQIARERRVVIETRLERLEWLHYEHQHGRRAGPITDPTAPDL